MCVWVGGDSHACFLGCENSMHQVSFVVCMMGSVLSSEHAGTRRPSLSLVSYTSRLWVLCWPSFLFSPDCCWLLGPSDKHQRPAALPFGGCLHPSGVHAMSVQPILHAYAFKHACPSVPSVVPATYISPGQAGPSDPFPATHCVEIHPQHCRCCQDSGTYGLSNIEDWRTHISCLVCM